MVNQLTIQNILINPSSMSTHQLNLNLRQLIRFFRDEQKLKSLIAEFAPALPLYEALIYVREKLSAANSLLLVEWSQGMRNRLNVNGVDYVELESVSEIRIIVNDYLEHSPELSDEVLADEVIRYVESE